MTSSKKSLDACPTSHGDAAPREGTTARALRGAAGRSYWKSLDELAGRGEFKDFLHREFPAFASELLDGSRRHFLRIMGASLALAGAATIPGCRRPDHKILPYAKDPEGMVIGKPTFFATTIPLPGGGCEGLLAETFEGRPTKLEGNPLHPANLGRGMVYSQSSILDLYDPDRDPAVISSLAQENGQAFEVTQWKQFVEFAGPHFKAFDASGGAGLAFLVEKATCPSRESLKSKVQARWKNARWYAYDGVDNDASLEATRTAFGSPVRELLDFAKAKVIVALDRDFLGGEGASLAESRGYAAGRYTAGAAHGRAAADSAMSRLYCIEPLMTLTGGQADHRLAVKPSRVGAAAMLIGAAVLKRIGKGDWDPAGAALTAAAASLAGPDLPRAWLDALVEELCDATNLGASAVIAGPSQPPAVHAACVAINAALGNVGKTVRYAQISGDASQSSIASIRSLTQDIEKGTVDTLVVVGANPCFDAPGDLGFAEKYTKVKHRIHLGDADETGQASTMHLARAHFLESWSDAETWDGVYSVIQPQIKPLFEAHNELEFLATILGLADTDPYAVVRVTLKDRLARTPLAANFESAWRRTLHDGLLNLPAWAGTMSPANWVGIQKLIASGGADFAPSAGVEAVFVAAAYLHDGRRANNGWLQELPHPVTKVVWDNPALIAPATAKRLGLSIDRHSVTPEYSHGQMITVAAGRRSVSVPLWPQPGMAEDTVALTLGYGRRVGGRVARGTGFDVNPLRTSDAPRVVKSVEIAPTQGAKPWLLACTQDHWTMEGRDILREIDLAAWKKFGDQDYSKDLAVQADPYDASRDINFAGRLGMESHAPANIDIYKRSQKQAQGLRFTELDEHGKPRRDEKGNIVAISNKYGKRLQQWGMSIDLTSCTGCGACTIACQAENNIPIVGKMETAKGREMHWIRVDRYYSSSAETNGIGTDDAIDPAPELVVQPVTCVHCENAPCEVVCPVNATTHDPEGTNNMAYNRCIGTRYCSNNCPYKVRRFNFFDYGTKQFRGDYAGKELVKKLPAIARPPSEYFVPPRLRQYKLEVAQLQYNPHVTVRSRGVMEKCTYCIQRINAAKVETKLAGLQQVPDRFTQTACEQACPTGAIVFGDIYDHDANGGKGSLVKQARNDPRSYALLAFLNTRPRTTYMLRLRNPNPVLVDDARKARWENPFHHGSHGDHGPAAPGGLDEHAPPAGEHKTPGHVMSLPVLAQMGALA